MTVGAEHQAGPEVLADCGAQAGSCHSHLVTPPYQPPSNPILLVSVLNMTRYDCLSVYTISHPRHVYTAPHSEADHVVDKLSLMSFMYKIFRHSVFGLHAYVFVLVLLRH